MDGSSSEIRAAFERAQRVLVAEGKNPSLALEESGRAVTEMLSDLALTGEQVRELVTRVGYTLYAATYLADLFASAVEEDTGESRLDWMLEHDAQVDRFVERMAKLSAGP